MASIEGESQHVDSREYAVSLDAQDPLRHLRKEFLIPSQEQLKSKSLPEAGKTSIADIESLLLNESTLDSRDSTSHDSTIYLCGNSLGVQPRLVSTRIQQYLTTWSTQGVFGHFKPLTGSPLPTWLDADSKAAENIAPIVGAQTSEVAVMETLTANLHLLMGAFYNPDVNGRHKIILESKAFPSDHFAVESQILHHKLQPSSSMITIEPISSGDPILTTSHILSIIAEHASSTAILLLPGIQFYTGEFLDIPTITHVARDLGIFVIWDLAHAVGNVPLYLHDWNVDAAAWCSYKYLNSGPGSIGGLFVHERHGQVNSSGQRKKIFAKRLAGWWGSDKSVRFEMDNQFVPIPGAGGFQLSNPSIFDITSLNASLEVFAMAGGMEPIRTKSVKITGYLETLLLKMDGFLQKRFEIITPKEQENRGAQLSLKLESGLLDVVMKELEERGVVVDERRPDVIRVAPAPLYNSYEDCWAFVQTFAEALELALRAKEGA